MTYTFEIESKPNWAELDQFPDRTIFQTQPWQAFVAEAQNASPIILRLLQSNQSVGYFTGLVIKRYGLKILGSPFPGWTTSYLGFNLSSDVPRGAVLEDLARFAFRELGCAHVELMDRRLAVKDVVARGWKHRIFRNFEIDLRPTEDEIFGQMKGSCRTSIRKSQREGVTIEIAGDPQFADDYYAQMSEVFAKQGLKPTYPVERVRLLMKHLLPTGNLLLLRARTASGECAATGIYPAFNDTMYFWGGASSRQFQILQPNEPLHWYAMLYWKEHGIAKCDMGGGGEYKRKYGGYDIEVPWIRKSRYPGLELARKMAQKMQERKQRIQA
jgi:hypothetical protein